MQKEKLYLTPLEASKYLHCSAYYFNVSAKAGKLPFEHMFVGNRLKIFKKDFFEKLGIEEEEANERG